jgi:hypothetical protein
MTNIWTNTFEDIRKPHFEMEDPYTSLQEKKEGKEVKKWWDDDGDGKGYEEGEVSGKFKKKKVKEEVEEIDENRMASRMGKMPSAPAKVGKATHSINDLVPSKPPSPEEKAKARKALKLGENRAMARDPEGSNSGHSKQPDPSKAGFTGIGNMSIAQIAKMSARIKKEKETQKEENLYTSKSSQQKIDVRKGIKNKIDTKPTTAEEVETWVAELVAEGYDLSEFTWEEMTDIYLDEAGTSAMAPRGDYQTTTATATQKQDPNAPLIAAKAKAAKAKVTKEIADLQVAKQSQRMKVDTNESVILYLAHRPDAFANLEEGVFDPKKSKMRSAGERSERTMTSAQRAAAKKEGERTAKIHSKGETVLAGLTKPQRKSSQPMGTTQSSKPAAPEANRKVTGKYDQLAKKASAILKSAKDK